MFTGPIRRQPTFPLVCRGLDADTHYAEPDQACRQDCCPVSVTLPSLSCRDVNIIETIAAGRSVACHPARRDWVGNMANTVERQCNSVTVSDHRYGSNAHIMFAVGPQRWLAG